MDTHVAFDNSVLSALIKSALDPNTLQSHDAEKARNARAFINARNNANKSRRPEAKKHLFLPAPVVTECVAHYKPEDQSEAMQLCKKIGRLINFDERAARICAQLQYERRGMPTQEDITKTRVKFDTMIAACAIAAGVPVLYHTDPAFEHIATLSSARGLSVALIPPAGRGNLFDES